MTQSLSQSDEEFRKKCKANEAKIIFLQNQVNALVSAGQAMYMCTQMTPPIMTADALKAWQRVYLDWQFVKFEDTYEDK